MIDSVVPGGGPLSGGNDVVITGSGFLNPALTFEGVVFDPEIDLPGTFSEAFGGTANVVSDTQIDVTAPDASVAADGQTSFATYITAKFDVGDSGESDNSVPAAPGDDGYVFGAPVIDSVVPAGGPLTGGNTVVITGSGFMNPALTIGFVVFDPTNDPAIGFPDGLAGIAATDVNVVSDTEIDVTAPDVTAAADGATSLATDVTAAFR